jgi:hypothetical protein
MQTKIKKHFVIDNIGKVKKDIIISFTAFFRSYSEERSKNVYVFLQRTLYLERNNIFIRLKKVS